MKDFKQPQAVLYCCLLIQLIHLIRQKNQQKGKTYIIHSSSVLFLGNMWSQEWNNILDIVTHYPNSTSVDITPQLVEQVCPFGINIGVHYVREMGVLDILSIRINKMYMSYFAYA